MKKLVTILFPLVSLVQGATVFFTHQTSLSHQTKLFQHQNRVRYHNLEYNIGTNDKTWKFTYYLRGIDILNDTASRVYFWQDIKPWLDSYLCQKDWFNILNSVQAETSYATALKVNDSINSAWAVIADNTKPNTFGHYIVNLAYQEWLTGFKVDQGVIMTISMDVNLTNHYAVLDAISAVKTP